MRKKLWFKFLILLILAVLGVLGAWPKGPNLDIPFLGIKKEMKIVRGLDLAGGSQLTYDADLGEIPEKDRAKAVDSLKNVIERRVNAFGVVEPTIYSSTLGQTRRVVVELPGVQDVDKALELIGKTAQLSFKEEKPQTEPESPEAQLQTTNPAENYIDTELSGKHLSSADVTFDSNTQKPQIALQFNAEGAKLFAEITGRSAGKTVAIFLDNEVVSAPRVEAKIEGGEAVITGQFTLEQAKNLVIQLNAGALPTPIKLVEQRTIGATLGQDSVNKSLYAGIIGIIFVSFLMIVLYRLLGVFSTIGLGLYLVFLITLMKLFSMTVTMGGIAGLILSIGMTMETDVLVFERIREELRAGQTFATSIMLGFKRAWPSIRDSSTVSLIITALLYTAGGTIRGFAVVLGFGILIGLLTTFLGTRALLDLTLRLKIFQKRWLFSVEKEAEL